MNTQVLIDKIADIASLLNASIAEAKEIEAKRNVLEKSELINTEREKRLNDKEIALAQRTRDVDAQAQYMEEQSRNIQLTLNKIAAEKKELEQLVEKKRQIEEERLQLEADKKELEGIHAIKDKFEAERMEFEKEKQLFAQEKLAILEQQNLLAIREQNIKQKEERIDKIERMTQV